jgi:hypothetical protein
MPRPNPIQYAERLYAAIRAANFSPISFLAFGNAVKDGVELRRMPRIAAEPFMRVVGYILELDGGDLIDVSDTAGADNRVRNNPMSDERTLAETHAPTPATISGSGVSESEQLHDECRGAEKPERP